ncbi:MAG: glycosyltransferase, partial [Opitutae bacterium]|nr:glycosyltransferase [Opitutae bacterium]
MIIVLLPAYNEEESLPALMPKLRIVLESMTEDYRVLVCDDGSSDHTREQLLSYAKEMQLE